MALFKLLRGQESDLKNQPLHDGYVWVTKDLQNMWFDYYDETDILVRKRINSEFADKLRYVADGETVELDPSEIATKSEITTAADSALSSAKSYTDTKTSGLASINYVDASIGNIPAITTAEIDEICGATIMAASEVLF